MATLEKYKSFDEMKKAGSVSKRKKPGKAPSQQKVFKSFGELLRQNMISSPSRKK